MVVYYAYASRMFYLLAVENRDINYINYIHIPDCAKAELGLAKSHRKVTTVPFVMVARSTGCCAIATSLAAVS